MHKKLAQLLFLISTTIFSSQTFACKFIADTRPLAERINEQPLVFIGTVIQNGESVVFNIENPIKGTQKKTYTLKNDKPSSCSIRFAKGQKWLFAGNLVMEPSILLAQTINGKTQTFYQEIRHNDTTAALKSEWQQCDTSSQCKSIAYACDVTSVNGQYLEQAKKYINNKGLNPATFNCLIAPQTQLSLPLCQENKCGIWSYKEQKNSPSTGGYKELENVNDESLMQALLQTYLYVSLR